MRILFKVFALVSMALVGLAMTVAQGQPPIGFGGKGGGKGLTYFALVANPQVQKELNATEKQLDMLPAAQLKALAEVFDAKQIKRLHEIYLQQRGNTAFLEVEIKKDLKITDDQANKIKEALDKLQKEQQEMFQGGNFDPEKLQALTELAQATNDRVQGILTADQKTAWSKMIGE